MKTKLFICMIFFSLKIFAQDISSYKHTTSDSLRLAIDVSDFHEKKINGMQQCFVKFTNELTLGFASSLIGSAITIGSFSSSNYNDMKNGILFGGALSLVGVIITLDSFKWMRRAGIRPSDYGFGFKIPIN